MCPRARRIPSFCENVAMLPRGTIYLQSFARGHGQTGALNFRDICAFGIARAQADAPQFVMGARFGEAALASVHEGQAHFLFLGEFCQVASVG